MKTILLYLGLSLCFTVSTKALSLDSLTTIVNNPLTKDSVRLYTIGEICVETRGYAPDTAIKYSKIGIDICEELKIDLNYGFFMNHIDVLYSQMGNYSGASVYSFKYLKFAEERQDTLSMIIVYGAIGNNYLGLGEIEKYIEYNEKAIVFADLINLPEAQRVPALQSLGIGHYELGDYEKSLEYYQEVERILIDNERYSELADIHLNIAISYEKLKNYEKAILYGEDALSQSIEDENLYIELYAQSFMVNLYQAIGKSNKSVESFERAKQLTKLVQAGEVELELLKDGVVLFEKRKDYRQAFEVHKEYIALRDSINFKENYKVLIDEAAAHKYWQESIADSIQNSEEVKRTKLEGEVILAKEQRNFYLSLAGVGLLIIVSGIFLFGYRRAEKQRREISKRDEEKEILLKEIHHRVKNNLQVISSLLDLQTRSLDDVSAIDALKDGQNRVMAMSLIHQRLYQTDNIGNIVFNDFTNQLFTQLKLTFDAENVQLKTSDSTQALDIDTAIPIGLILNELITNSFKHAFTDGEAGTISIFLTLDSDKNQFVLEYSDSGKGLPEHIQFEGSKSMGLRLISRLSFQLFGEATYSDKKFTISFRDISQGIS